jgi:hypothetical protein
MHISQTKWESRVSGGPQYYLHDAPPHVKEFLRKRGACPVVLQTPYGIAESAFTAVGRDHKLSASGKPIRGKVGHDRIQGVESIGAAIRYWYGLKNGRDFRQIDLEAVIHPKGHFILVPTAIQVRGAKRATVLEKATFPLSFHRDFQSKLWRRQIEACQRQSPSDVAWAGAQILRVVADHRQADTTNVHEADLLRVAGALSILGLDLGLYFTRGYDCPTSQFSFADLPLYPCPIEVKKRSSRFSYQITRYTDLPRVVVLCLEHDLVNPPDHVDVVELPTLGNYLAA